MKMAPWTVFGAKSRPGRVQGRPRTGTVDWGTRLLEPFWPKLAPQGLISGSQENRKSAQNRTFADRLALSPSKNGLWKGIRKKHEKLMKNRCENEANFRCVLEMCSWKNSNILLLKNPYISMTCKLLIYKGFFMSFIPVFRRKQGFFNPFFAWFLDQNSVAWYHNNKKERLYYD